MSEKFLKHLPISNGKTKQNKKDHGLTGSSPVEICIEVNCLNSLIVSYLKIGRKKDYSKSTDEQMLISAEWFLKT